MVSLNVPYIRTAVFFYLFTLYIFLVAICSNSVSSIAKVLISIGAFTIPYVLALLCGSREFCFKRKYGSKKKAEVSNSLDTKFYNETMRYEQALKKYKRDRRLFSEYSNHISDCLEKIIAMLWRNCVTAHPVIDRLDEQTEELPQRGYSEDILLIALQARLGDCLYRDCRVGNYYPDIIVDIDGKYFIDIEIDEPYAYDSHEAIHYIGCGDEERNNYFIDNNWMVVRFSESQVRCMRDRCVDIVDALAKFIKSGDTNNLTKVWKWELELKVKRWTYKEAKEMSEKNTRDDEEYHIQYFKNTENSVRKMRNPMENKFEKNVIWHKGW